MHAPSRTLLFRSIVIVFGLFGFLGSTSAQVAFSLSVNGAPDRLKEKTQLTAKLIIRIDPGWHISSLTTPGGGPDRTVVAVAHGAPFKIIGKIDAPEPDCQHDKAFDVDVETYKGEVEFKLPLQATAVIPPGTKLAVEITYQACRDETCMLPKTERVEALIGPPAGKK